MHILIAPNAFKNSLDAAKVAEAINNGLHKSKLSCTTTCFPVADGGDGTAGLLIDHLGGQLIHAIVNDPLKEKYHLLLDGSKKIKPPLLNWQPHQVCDY